MYADMERMAQKTVGCTQDSQLVSNSLPLEVAPVEFFQMAVSDRFELS